MTAINVNIFDKDEDEDLCDMEGCDPNTHFAVYILSPTPDQRTTI